MADVKSEIPRGDQNIWLSYGVQVKKQLAGAQQAGTDDVVFICPPTRLAMGNAGIQESVNFEVHKHANTLLPAGNSPFYMPVDIGYFDKFSTLVNNIDPARGVTTATADQVTAINNARRKNDKAKTNWFNAYRDAEAKYQEYLTTSEKRSVTPSPWQTWLKTNSQDVSDYEAGFFNTQQELQSAYVDAYGTQANDVVRLLENVRLALETRKKNAGYNMRASSDVPVDGTLKEEDIRMLPAYELDGYKQQLGEWRKGLSKTPHKFRLNTKDGESHSWNELGHKTDETSTGNSFWKVFNNKIDESHKATWDNSKLEGAVSEVDFTLLINHMNVFEASAGQWNRGDLRGDFKFMGNAPEAKDWIRPRLFLIGYGVGLEATFSGGALKEAHSMVTDLKSEKSAGLDILGISVRGSTQSESSNVVGSDDVKFDTDSGTLKIAPENNQVPVLLGVLGKKFKF